MENSKILVKVFSISEGIKKYADISIVRIKSKDFNLLILVDYYPILGKIDGNISLESEGNPVELTGVKGYFIHKNNEFNLILKEA